MVPRLSQAVKLCRRRAERLPFEEGQPFSISVAYGVFFQLPTHPDSGSFHAALRHFFLKYVSIPAKKCLAQRKNSRCRSHWELEEYTLVKILKTTPRRRLSKLDHARNGS